MSQYQTEGIEVRWHYLTNYSKGAHLVIYDLPTPIPLLQHREELNNIAVVRVEFISGSIKANHDGPMLVVCVARRRDNGAIVLGIERRRRIHASRRKRAHDAHPKVPRVVVVVVQFGERHMLESWTWRGMARGREEL